MPLLALAVASYAAGLLLGFGGAFTPAMVAAVALTALAARGRDARFLALAALLGSGVAVAALTQAHERRCRATLLARGSWRAVLDGEAFAGAFVTGTVHADGCTLPVAASIERGSAHAGATVTLFGEAEPSERGVRVIRARLVITREGRSLRAVRAALGARIDSLFGGDAGLVRALLIADTHGLDPALRDRYAAAGIVHVLSISGLHVAIIAMAIRLLFVAMRLRPRTASLATIVITAGYVAVIGAPPPAVRSGVMLGATTLSRVAQRPTSAWAMLALGALVPLLAPRTALDVGYQLSVVGMASLIASGAVTRRVVALRLEGWGARLASVLIASTLATIATAPLVAWHFGRVSLAAPLTNVAVTPVIGVLQPTLFLAVVLAPVMPLARVVAAAAHPMVRALDGIATVGAALPGASLAVAPTLAGAMLAGVAVIGLLAACVAYFPARPLAAALGSLALAAWIPAVPMSRGVVELHVIDVGQGDALAIRTPRGRWVLVDAGPAWRGGDAGRSTVIPYLRRYGGAVALFILTHPHADHVGGASSVLRALRPGAYWDGAFAGTSEPYRASLDAARDAGVPWHRVHPEDTLTVDSVRLRVLAPDSAWMVGLADPNNASVIVIAEYRGTRFLLMGDAERDEERELLGREGEVRATVLKVGHHGSATSSTSALLAAVRPRVAIISVGVGNHYALPSGSVVRDLAGAGAAVLRTDMEGTIVVRSDGRTVEVQAAGDRWTVHAASGEPTP